MQSLEEKNKLEEEFENTVKEVKQLIDSNKDLIEQELKLARQHLLNAQDLSNKSGIPFVTDISFIHNTYVPKTFSKESLKNLDIDIISELCGMDLEEDDFIWNGWRHSAIC